ncbi:ESCRT-II complex subunit-domain-containing protein [Syncephalis pseudoplumigaleata]|uniref:ESCRT-II complex subunit VPS25 n=1 Tax=Syncephalis pseudoplumigaleata TaxID=1712513 RepID=A0A4P9YWX4_9FUNG|nr:ESCRT-II complex subunit-domain-containing protein [Syncephalis pseudoplumigaleata]|eukprot:RKP24633.1 ESCRT-II complex subunit-domain-containing protein [Syncephalis pseudoplumigaleata]
MSQSSPSLVFPAIHRFPPFYTRQPTDATRARQLELWSDLLLAYGQQTRQTRMRLDALLASELCVNQAIERRLSRDLLVEIVDACVGKGDAEWTDTSKTELFIYWRRPDAWAQLIHDWIIATGQQGSVLTLHELSNSSAVEEQAEFYRLDERMLRKALRVLADKAKAQIFSSGTGEDGVKFF